MRELRECNNWLVDSTQGTLSNWRVNCNRELGIEVSGTLILRSCRLLTEIRGDVLKPEALVGITSLAVAAWAE